MTVSLKKDSLAFQFGLRPGVLARNMGGIPVTTVVERLNGYMAGHVIPDLFAPNVILSHQKVAHPESDALSFYLMNHAMGVIRQKYHPLQSIPPECVMLVNTYHDVLASRAMRMFFYLLLICTRESRHAKYFSNGSSGYDTLKAKYGYQCVKFTQGMNGFEPMQAANHFRESPPDVSLGEYTQYLRDLFFQGDFGGSYGGPKWGEIAKVLANFVTGNVSAELMLDTAFTLAHNTAPIFNKGMLYHPQNVPALRKILDVQRSGQIPQYIAGIENHDAGFQYVTAEVQKLLHASIVALGNSFYAPGYVDWYLVEELGSMSSYQGDKDMQVKKHGFPSKFKAKMEAEAAKKAAADAKTKAEEMSMIEIYPGGKVKKVDREYA